MQVDPRRLDRLDSPQRVAWLRQEIAGYTRDLAARHYFRLSTTCANVQVLDCKAEIVAVCESLASKYGLTDTERDQAFKAEWDISTKIAQQCGEKLKIIALSHIKMCGSSAGLVDTWMVARNNFPDGWPHLTQANFEDLAAGFRPNLRGRRG